MKLDPTALRYLTRDDFRVLTAVEMGMKNHDLVPRELVVQIASLRHGGAEKMISTLLRHKLLHHETRGFDGYRLTTLGYDYLALRALSAKGLVSGVGTKIGVGKESDIFLVENDDERTMVLKLHRLGRTSFRKIKTKRDYHGRRGHPSWIYLSRLASQKEYAYMKALHEAGFPVPEPIEANRHCVLMSLLTGWPLHSVMEMNEPEKCMEVMLSLVVRLGKCGLIHGDFNEFNVAVDKEDSSKIVMYDFPQMVSMNHPNAKMYFDRDVEGVYRFFQLRFGVDTDMFERPEFDVVYSQREIDLDVKVGASGFSKQEAKDLEDAMVDIRHKEHDEEDEDENEEREEDEDEVDDEDEDDRVGVESQQNEDAVKPEVRTTKSGKISVKPVEEVAKDKVLTDRANSKAVEECSSTGDESEVREERRKLRVQKEVAQLIRKQMQGGKTSRNTIKSRERRRIKREMDDW